MKLFGGGKPDHPLADPKEAKRVLEALPANDPVKALDELMHWMESVAAVEGFKPEDRVQLQFMLDDAAQPRVRKLARDYFAAARPSRFQENRLWTALHAYWKQAGYAYARSVEQFVQNVKGVDAAKGLLPLLLVRTLRSFAQQVKWMHMRYGPIDPASWGVFNSVYAFAEAKQLAQSKVTVYPGVAGDFTPQLEFLKGAMFSASAPDGLLPLEVELAERLIAQLAPRFALANAPAPGLVFWTDLARAMAPVRPPRAPQAGPGLRCFGAGAALDELHALAEQVMVGGRVPPEVNLGGSYEPPTVLEVMRHLEMYWSPQAPERKAQRHPVKSRLSVTHGYDGAVAVLGGGDSLDFENQNSESWIVENVSDGGYGAIVPPQKIDWVKVGALIGMKGETSNYLGIGLIRRITRDAHQQRRVGIQVLTKTAIPVAISKANTMSTLNFDLREETAILLTVKPDARGEVDMLLREGIFNGRDSLEMTLKGGNYQLMPLCIVEAGDDFYWARFKVKKPSA